MALEPITREEKYLAKAAGQSVEVPEPITRKEMFLDAVAKSGGGSSGGGGADLLDENGIIKKEYFPEGFPYGSLQKVTVMPETVLTRDPDSQFYTIPNVLELTKGRQYTVKLSMSAEGETYEHYFPTVCREAPENEEGIKWLLGNLALLNLGEDTGEDFVIGLIAPEMAEAAGIGGIMMVSLAIDTITVSITGIPEDFSFIDPGYVENALILVKVAGDIENDDYTTSRTAKEVDSLLRLGNVVMVEYRKTATELARNYYQLGSWLPDISASFYPIRPVQATEPREILANISGSDNSGNNWQAYYD